MIIQDYTNAQLIEAYEKTSSVHKAGKLLGVHGTSLHRRLQNCGYDTQLGGKRFTDEDEARLSRDYEKYVSSLRLDDLAEEMGRTKNFICRKAKSLGLTNICRKNKLTDEGRSNISQCVKDYIKSNGHPRGATGMKHTPEALKKISAANLLAWKNRTDAEKEDIAIKMIKTRIQNGTLVPPRHKVSWKQGWREIGGYKKYYRSRWEANYARYLEWLKGIGEIKAWEHEPDVFWFEGIRRGCMSYLPDFKVTENDGSIAYHEVKGWMDARSKTKIKRMAKYYPDVKLIVIDAKPYKSIERKIGCGLDGWEK